MPRISVAPSIWQLDDVKRGALAFNIGNGVVESFDAVMAAVRKLLPDLKVEVAAGEAGKSKTQPLDISAAKAQLQWAPAYSLEAAFADYLRDLRAIGPGAKARLGGRN